MSTAGTVLSVKSAKSLNGVKRHAVEIQLAKGTTEVIAIWNPLPEVGQSVKPALLKELEAEWTEAK